MLAVAAADQAAFTELVGRYQPVVRRLCAVLLQDETLARDVAQEAFLKLWLARTRYQPIGKFRAYLFAIVRNACASARHEQRKHPPAETVPESAFVGADVELVIERQRIVRGALSKLEEKFRVPLLLRYFVGLSHDEIAEVIGRTTSATRSRVFYGLKELAAIIPEEV